jgi:hypothetical protein
VGGELAELVPFVQITATGLLCVILLLLLRAWLRGAIVAQRELDYLREDRDARLAEKDQENTYLRDAHATSERARELLNQQNRELVASLRAFEHFFASFQRVLEKGSEGDAVR